MAYTVLPHRNSMQLASECNISKPKPCSFMRERYLCVCMYLSEVKLTAEVMTSSWDWTMTGILRQPGDFRTRFRSFRVSCRTLTGHMSILVTTTNTGTLSARARPRCSVDGDGDGDGGVHYIHSQRASLTLLVIKYICTSNTQWVKHSAVLQNEAQHYCIFVAISYRNIIHT